MKFDFKVPDMNLIFWMVLIGFIVALIAIKAANNVDLVRDATR